MVSAKRRKQLRLQLPILHLHQRTPVFRRPTLTYQPIHRRLTLQHHNVMGGTNFSDKIYADRVDDHKTRGTDYFVHTASIKRGDTAAGAHVKLDPSKPNAVGKLVRESFDSPAHPTSHACAIFFDTTGSMGQVPRIFVEKLGKLMKMFIQKGVLEHPHILMGAVNDATTDATAPLQVGQFEAGNEMDESLGLIYIEGGGGGTKSESYELAIYFMARHSDLDCLKKRGRKGYMFLLGDERPYPKVSADIVKRVIGDTLEADIPLEDILKELRQSYEVFWIMPGGTQHANDPDVTDHLKSLFGQNYFFLPNPAEVCELVVSTVGVAEGYELDRIKSDLVDVGIDADAAARATDALVTYASSRALTKGATASGELVPAGTDAVARL